MQRMQEEIERVRRHGSSLSVLLFDLDHFKKVNDTYGHEMGDRVLKSVADASAQVKRITDVAARIGGEEFALLLPHTDLAGARDLAERLRSALSSNTHSIHQRDVRLSASFGVALKNADDNLATLLMRADRHLYDAKQAGRDQIVSDPAPPSYGSDTGAAPSSPAPST